MSNTHTFIFTPGEWIGHGKVTISGSKEAIQFITKWIISPKEKGIIRAEQTVEKQGFDDILVNRFQFSDVDKKVFSVKLENEVIGDERQGKARIDDNSIFWAFEEIGEGETVGVAGVEMYTQQSEDDYTLHAEYFLDETHRTIVEGHIWRKK